MKSGAYEKHLKHVRIQLKTRRDFTLQLLIKYFSEIAFWNVPNGGFYIWLQLIPVISVQKLFELALQEGILINPGSIYDKNAQQHIRLSYAYATFEQLEEGLIKLSQLIYTLSKK